MTLEHASRMLPVDYDKAILVGRMLLDAGPTPVLLNGGEVIDVSAHAPTVADLLELDDIRSLDGPVVCDTPSLDG